MDQPADMEEVMAAVARLQAGDPDARTMLLSLWTADPGASSTRLCTLAHFLADTETTVAAELAWDRLALEAATGHSDGDHEAVTRSLQGFLPSLHLNLGDCLRRMGDLSAALFHAQAGLGRAHALSEEGYGRVVRGALERLLAKVS